MRFRCVPFALGCVLAAGGFTTARAQTVLPAPTEADRAFAAKLAALPVEQAKAAINAAPAEQRTAGLAQALRELGNKSIDSKPADSLPLYLEAQQVARPLDQPALLAMIDFGVGVASRLVGDSEAALDAFNEAVALDAKTTLAPIDRGKIYGGRAVARMYMGDTAGSIEDGKTALQQYQTAGDEIGVAHTDNGLGNAENWLGHYSEARTYYEQGLALARKYKQRQGEAFLLNNIANTYLEQHNPELAVPYCLESIRIKEELGNKEDLVTSLVNVARIYQGTKRDTEAVAAIQRAHAVAGETTRADLQALVLAEWGALDITGHRPEVALDHLRQAAALSNGRADLLLENETLVQISQAEFDLGRYREALNDATKALAFAESAGILNGISSASRVIGRAQEKLGDLDAARTAFERAVAAAEQMRDEASGGPELASKFFSEFAEDIQQLAAVNAEQKNWEAAFAASEREKGRTLLDLLTGGRASLDSVLTPAERGEQHALEVKLSQAERQSLKAAMQKSSNAESFARPLHEAHTALAAFHARIYAEHPELERRHGRAKLITLAETASLLPSARAAIIEFEVTESATFVFVLTRGVAGPSLTGYRVPLTRSALQRMAVRFARALETRDPGFAAQSAALYRLLLAPASRQLAGKSALVVVPSAELWRVPVQALQDLQGRFLAERFAVSYAPSLSVLRAYQASTDPRPTSLIAFADPVNDLPEAVEELRVVRALYGGRASAFLHNAATVENFRSAANSSRANELLLATHGVYDDRNPMGSFLVLASGTPAAKTATLDAGQVAEMKLSSALVVLSACETARGQYRAGEGMLGMGWAFLAAGSQAAIASQWRVDSAGTTRLMTEFHRALRHGSTSSSALQQAELALARDPQYRHPFYWAGFVLLGRP